MTPQELNQLLEQTRDQKFRKRSEQQLDGSIKRSIALQGISRSADSVEKSAQTRRQQQRRVTDQQRELQRAQRLGKPLPANKKPKTQEHKEKISQRLTGRPSYVRTSENRKNHKNSVRAAVGRALQDPDQTQFETLSDAGKHYAKIWNIGEITAGRKIRVLCCQPDSGWKYI